MDIFENSWAGVVTEAHLSNLTSLKDLSIAKYSLSSYLSLVFNVITQWIPPFKLRYIKLRSCQVGPRFPAWFRNQNELETLILRNARISDTLPEWLSKLNLQLNELDLGYNEISGRVPNSLKFRPQSTVYLNQNSFEGPLPLWTSNVSALFFSTISFLGQFIRTLAKDMLTLDLGDNRLSGNIPEWIGEMMPSVLILCLRSNLFEGKLPSELCSLSSLYILDPTENNFSGAIPSCFGNLSGMTYDLDIHRYEGKLLVVTKGTELLYENTLSLVNIIDLSSNNLSGEVTEELTDLSRLGTLNLSINHLTGKIPEKIGSLQPLETLDLSRNQFSAPILPSRTSLTSMNYLNLSYNNFTGQIPSGNQFETVNDPSIYEGNLCTLWASVNNQVQW
ncbi:hypothetical protein F0562_004819 [Nyssa sinensis]|uniref:Leucine-rich repeat-containing N-terminal plant-type domain-containing protein n=1 Tax=Nyssa sinensis TaxID=561372 RepID=A0A5J5AHQ7_9ASTE|nr:hypothetical protein F0562_004819 [Nyssa sinensis]